MIKEYCGGPAAAHSGGSRSLVRRHAASARPTQHWLPISSSCLVVAAASLRRTPGPARAGGPAPVLAPTGGPALAPLPGAPAGGDRPPGDESSAEDSPLTGDDRSAGDDRLAGDAPLAGDDSLAGDDPPAGPGAAIAGPAWPMLKGRC
jgi:hypothetical protein